MVWASIILNRRTHIRIFTTETMNAKILRDEVLFLVLMPTCFGTKSTIKSSSWMIMLVPIAPLTHNLEGEIIQRRELSA